MKTDSVARQKEREPMLYRLYVNQVYVMCNDWCESTEEFVDFYITMIEDTLYDNFKNTDVERATEKLSNRDYTTAVDTELNITDVYVTI